MALRLNFGGTNNLMKTIMWYMLQNKLGEQSNQRMVERQNQYLETSHKNRLSEAYNRWMYDISKDEPAKRLGAQIFISKQGGMDTSGLEQQLHDALKKRAKVTYVIGSGLPLTEQDADNISEQFANSGLQTLVSQSAQTTRQGRQLAQTEKARKTTERGLNIRQQELNLRKQQQTVGIDNYKIIHSNKIQPLRTFLMKFVGKGNESEAMMLIRGFLNMPESEQKKTKQLLGGAISPQNLYKVLKRLDQIDTKFLNGKGTQADLDWISDIYDLFSTQSESKNGFNENISNVSESGISSEPPIIPKVETNKATPFMITTPQVSAPPAMTDEQKIAFLTNYLITTHHIPPEEAARKAREAILGTGTIQ